MKFSITIPAYKAKYLQEAIESVLAQTLSDFELIIVNDASPEDLDSIVEKFHDPRIRYFRNEKNCGALRVVDNWNICLSKVQGVFVICMGDDDKLLPNCLETYNQLINKYPDLDVYHGWTQIIDENSKICGMQEARPEREGVYSALWHRMHGRLQYIGDFLYRTSALREAGGYFFMPMAWGSDDVTAFRAMEKKGVANTQTPVFQYRKSSITLTSSSHADIKMKGVISTCFWERKLLSRNSNTPDSIETIYCEMLKHDFNKFQREKKVNEIRNDFQSGSRMKKLLYWYKHMDVYDIDIKIIIKSLIKSFKS